MNCPHGLKCIEGSGPRPCRYFCLAEAPGQMEVNFGEVLVGPTGMEWNRTYLPLAGLKRYEVYATNTVKHCNTVNSTPTQADIDRCVNCMLREELEEVEPEIIFLMGATACSLISDIDLDVQHGVPFKGSLMGYGEYLVPMYHPALGLHETRRMSDLLEDWEKLKPWLRDGEWQWARDEFPLRNYLLAKSLQDVDQYFHLIHPLTLIDYVAVDSETHGNDPFSVQVSRQVGTGLMVLEQDVEIMRRLARNILNSLNDGGEIIFHNAPADMDVLGRHLRLFGKTSFRFRDTMQEAHHLGLPQALKALSYRLLGRKRKSWGETVTSPSIAALQEWLATSIVYAQEHLTVEEERWSEKTGRKLKSKFHKSEQERVLTRILTHCDSDTYDPWKKLKEAGFNNGERWTYPVKGIGNCDLNTAVEYGCSDADDTLAIALIMEDMRRDRLGKVIEEDWDV